EEVERLITIPLENELNGIARVTVIRSDTLFGLSNIRVVFADGTDDYWARQQAQERIAQAQLPADAKPGLGPMSSVIGEVYRYTLESKTMSLVDLKALQDWVLEREFRQVPGVADVVSWGGGTKQYEITVDPARLRAYNLTLKQVLDAAAASNSNAGGGYIAQGEYRVTVRGLGLVQSMRDIENIVVSAQKGTPVRVRDIGTVGVGTAIRLGVLGRDHDDDLVQGIVLMRKGENTDAVIQGVARKIEHLKRTLPAGVELRDYYSRDRLVRTTVTTVMRNLIEGAVLVVILLSLFLYNIRAALIVTVTIPLSLLFAFIFMDLRGIPANLLSLRAITFGIIVDGAVIMTENILRHLSEHKPTARRVVRDVQHAATEVPRPPTFPVIPILGAAGLLAISLWTFSLLGKEFLPELDEGDLWVRVQFPVGVSIEGVRPYVREIRERLLRFPEVRVVVSQLGAPDDGTDPEGLDNLEFYVGLKPRDEWQAKDKAKLVTAMTNSLAGIPGITANFSQPIKDNVDEALAG